MTQIAGPTTVAVEVNRQRALDLRIEGNTYQAIADALGLKKTRAYELVQEALADLRESNAEKAVQVRDIEIARLDAMLKTLWPKRGEARIADTLLRLAQRRSDLLGLDAPKSIRLAGEGGGPIRTQGEVVTLTPAERANRLREFGLGDLIGHTVNGSNGHTGTNGNGARDN